jgi:hypothetical protein
MTSQADRELYGVPDDLKTLAVSFFRDRRQHGSIGKYIWHSRRIPSWTRGVEAVELARLSDALPEGARIVEVGSFLGASAVLLAGPRKLKGSGHVHCVDPFDGSGDAFSAPIYRTILGEKELSPRAWFEANIARAGVTPWVSIEQGRSDEVVNRWSEPIDLLVLDGDQSYEAVKSAYDSWTAFLKTGGILVLHNATPGYRMESHDGHSRVGEQVRSDPAYSDVRYVGTMMVAKKLRD